MSVARNFTGVNAAGSPRDQVGPNVAGAPYTSVPPRNLSGDESPVGVVHPEFAGQVYEQSDGTIWKADTLLDDNWTEIGTTNTSGTGFMTFDPPLTSLDGAEIAPAAFSGLAGGLLFPTLVTLTGAMGDFGLHSFADVTYVEFTSLVAVQNGVNVDIEFMPSMTRLSFPKLTTVSDSLILSKNAVLSVIELPVLVTLVNLDISINPSLEVLSLPSLTSWPPGSFTADSTITALNLPALTDDATGKLTSDINFTNPLSLVTLNLSALVNATDLDLNNVDQALMNLDISSLETVLGNVIVDARQVMEVFSAPKLASVGDNLNLSGQVAMTTISIPLLQSITNDAHFEACTVLNSLNLASLATVGGGFNANANPLLTSLSFPALVSVTVNISIYDSVALTSFLAPLYLPSGGAGFDASNCALDAASVNHILARHVAAGVTTNNIFLDGGTNAAPTGQGIADKAALILAGNNVHTN